MAPTFALAALLAGCASTQPTGSTVIPPSWLSVPEATRIGSLTLDAEGKVSTNPERKPPMLSDGPIRLEGETLFNGEKVLAEKLGKVDSLDLSEVRGEVAFSAMHEGNFDIALINTEGGAIHWMPNDPADEVAVQWAPRGHKISYIIRAPGGDVVRTLHIPTAFQFALPFPNATIHALAWDPPAEKFAVAYSTPDSSDRVEVVKYDGEQHRTAIEPQKKLDVEVAPFAPGALVLRPRDIHYGEKLPLVIWRADDFSWSDARAALLTNARVAVVVTERDPDAELWRVVESTTWLDATRVFVVGSQSTERPGVVSIIGDDTVASGRYRQTGSVVAVAPAVVQSVAAGFIADQLERNPAPHGR